MMTLGTTLRRLAGQPETWSALGLIAWAEWVALSPGGLGSLPIYRVLTDAFGVRTLDVAGFILGHLQLASVIYNRRWPRIVMTFLVAAFYLTITNGLWLGAPTAAWAALSFVLGLMNTTLLLLLCCRKHDQ